MSTIAGRLKKFRVASGLTQEQLAKELGVTRQALSNWEHGKTQPDLEMIKRISDVLQVDVKKLIYGEEETKGKKETQRCEITSQEESGEISTIRDIDGAGSTVTAELPKEENNKQGFNKKKGILITVCVCSVLLLLLISTLVIYLPFYYYKHSMSKQDSKSGESQEIACLLSIPEEKPKNDCNVKAVDSETLQWFNTCMAIYLSANHLDLELYGGYEEDDYALSDAQYRLSRDWSIGSRQDTYEILRWLLGEGHRSEYEEYKQKLIQKELLNKGEVIFLEQLRQQLPEVSDNQKLNRYTTVYRANKEYSEVGINAWDYCRAIQVVSTAYYAGYYSLSEALQQSLLIGEQLQSEYSSWEEVCGSYLYGYLFWQKVDSGDSYGPGAVRKMVYQDLLQEADNPYASNNFKFKLKDTWSNAGFVMELANYTYKMGTNFDDETAPDNIGYEYTYRYKGDGSSGYSSKILIRYDMYYPEEEDYISEDVFLTYVKKGLISSYGEVWERNADDVISMGEGMFCYSYTCHNEELENSGAVRTAHLIRKEGEKELLIITDTCYEKDAITEWKQEIRQVIDSVKFVKSY